MSKKTTLKPLAVAVGAAFGTSLAGTGIANAAENPFAMSDLSSGYMVAEMAEGKCGGQKKMDKEGKCGAKQKAVKEGSAACRAWMPMVMERSQRRNSCRDMRTIFGKMDANGDGVHRCQRAGHRHEDDEGRQVWRRQVRRPDKYGKQAVQHEQ